MENTQNAIYDIALLGMNLSEIYDMPVKEFTGLYNRRIEMLQAQSGKSTVRHLNERQKDMIKQAKEEDK